MIQIYDASTLFDLHKMFVMDSFNAAAREGGISV